MENTNPTSRKERCVLISSALVMDKEAAHRKKMGNALWLFVHLLLHASREGEKVMRSVDAISSETRISKRTIIRWLARLRKENYIETKNTGRNLEILLNLRNILWKNNEEEPE